MMGFRIRAPRGSMEKPEFLAFLNFARNRRDGSLHYHVGYESGCTIGIALYLSVAKKASP